MHLVIGAAAGFLSAKPAPDFDRYYEIATGHGRPYVDYEVEHPIGTLLVFKFLALTPRGRASFGLAVVGTNLAADGIVILALLWGWGLMAAAYFAVAVIPVLGLLLNRIDLWPMAAAAVAVAAWQRDRRLLTALGGVIGGALKLWPLPFLVLLVVPRRGRVAAAPVVVCAMVAGALAAGWAWVAGWRGLYEVVTFREARGWQIESVVGALLHLFGAASPRLESGSWRIGSISGPISILMFALAAPLCLWSVWRGGRTRHVGNGWLAGVSSLLLLSPLLSAQFVGWLVPGAAIAWADGDRRLALVAASAVLLTELFWNWYWAVIQSATPALVVVVIRNAVLAALALSAIVAPGRASPLDADL